VDTIFDLASLTKVVATTTAVMQQKKARVRLNDPVARYVPQFAQNGKGDIRVRWSFSYLAIKLSVRVFGVNYSFRREF
jgi:hypothetical protein